MNGFGTAASRLRLRRLKKSQLFDTHIAILVERNTRFTMLVKLPARTRRLGCISTRTIQSAASAHISMRAK